MMARAPRVGVAPMSDHCAQFTAGEQAVDAANADLHPHMRLFARVYIQAWGLPVGGAYVAVTIFIVGRTPAGKLASVRTLAVWT
jgi:hypothetical protein